MPDTIRTLADALRPRLQRVPFALRAQARYQLNRFAAGDVPWLSMPNPVRLAMIDAGIVAPWTGSVMLQLVGDPSYRPLPRLAAVGGVA